MTAGDQRPERCTRCGAAVEGCVFCEHGGCREPLCYRCVRLILGEEVAQPHEHGG